MNKLQFSKKTDRRLGARKDTWCEFHRAHDHDTERCLALKYQLAKLVTKGFLVKYLQDLNIDQKGEDQPREHNHETPIFGDFNTIVDGFSGVGYSSSSQNRYSSSVLSLETRVFPTVPSLFSTSANLEDVYSHEDDHVVLSFIMMGLKVH